MGVPVPFAARKTRPPEPIDHASDCRKVLVQALPAVDRVIVPLFRPMERAVLSALSDYSDKELALLLDFVGGVRDAATAAMTALQGQAKPASKTRRGSRRIGAAKRAG